MKKVLATILALVMAIGLCSISWATESELPTAVNGVIKLTENVTLTARWEVAANTEITLDLNGYSITSAGQVIMNNGKLTIRTIRVAERLYLLAVRRLVLAVTL